MRAMRVDSVAVAMLLAATTACVGSDTVTIGPRTSSGVVRLSDDSFGLLVYPCLPDTMVSEVVLVDVELDPDTLTVVNSQPLLRELYPQPVAPADLIVSTATDALAARPGAEREVIDAELLDRFNKDRDYLTAIEPVHHFLTLDAFAPDGTDISGTGSLQSRFSAEIGEISGFGPDPVAIAQAQCSGREPPAWDVVLP